MASRLLQRLETDIARAEGVLEREALKARRAALLARHGNLAEARFALAGLRTQSQRLRNPVLSTWVVFVDGLIDHCESLAPSAREKFRRAHSLALEASDATLRAECAAWLAVTDLNANDFEGLVAHAQEALRDAPAEAHSARARAALVVADAYRHAGNDDAAQPWYQRVRQHATAEGDVSLVSMLLHNLAAFRAGRISLADAFGRPEPEEAQRVLMEAESTGNYDAGVGNAQLNALVPLLRAQLLVVLGRHDEAIALIDAQLPRARLEGQAHREARFLADAAYAEARLGRLDEAARRLRVIHAVLPILTEIDDQAAAHARLEFVAHALGRDEAAAAHAAAARAAFERHRIEQHRLAAALDAHLAGLDRPVT